MKTKAIIFSLCFTAFAQIINAQNFVWAKRMGGGSYDYGYSIALDASGNVYTTGCFSGTVDFDPGPGVFNLTSAGGHDIFISKLDSNGNFLWAKRIGGGSSDVGYSIALDASGNVYTTGYFSNTVDFDPGAGVFNLTSASGCDIFVSKLDSNGNFLWAKNMGGEVFVQETGYSIALDASGNVYTTGNFQGTADFDPGPGVFNLTSAGGHDIFISKLDSNGNFLWAKSMGGIAFDYGLSITLDASGNVYTTGYFGDTVDFDPGPGVFNLTSAGGYDIFISKLDSNGNFLWARSMGGGNHDYGNSIAVDASGNIYTTGYFSNTVDFDPGAGVFNLTSAGGNDIFISKLDSNGNFLWAKRIGGGWHDAGYSIALDASGNVYTTGLFYGTVDFDPGPAVFNLTSYSSHFDIFIFKLDSSGNFVWAKGIGGINDDRGLFIAVDASGNVYTTGYFSNTVDFDPGPGVFNLTSAGESDIFVLKLTCKTYSTQTVTACDSYTWIDGNTYTTSNNSATYALTNSAGCDSVITLNLTINSVSDISTTVVGATISANNSSANYQWLDCNNNYAVIPGETNQSFTTSANGLFAVELLENNCVDTSACVNITTVETIENISGSQFTVYPNPTNGQITIVFENELSNVQLTVRNVMGQDVFQKKYSSVNHIHLTFEGSPGVYFVEIVDNDISSVLKLIKE